MKWLNCEEIRLVLVGFVIVFLTGTAVGQTEDNNTEPTGITAGAKILYVDADASTGGDGQTWGTAYKYLQDGLGASVSEDQIWVADGIYKPDVSDANQMMDRTGNPTGTGDRFATFELKNGVAIKGGYAGFGEPDPNTRDIEVYETVLSGDLLGNDGQSFTHIYENSYHIVTGSGTNDTAVLDGFIITAGNANGSNHLGRGGGMYNDNGSPTLTNCIFYGNSAHFGSGMGNRSSSSPTLTNCTFSGNSARLGGGQGGGMANWSSSPTLINCTFSGNSARNGGGMASWDNCSPMLTNCIFWGNTASQGGSQIHNGGGCSATVSYSDVQGGWPGETNIDADPYFADPQNGDYRLKSQAGRWDPLSESWTQDDVTNARQDDVTNQCIDAGDPMSPIGLEPFPNGGFINMGAYGGTAQASKSYFGQPPCGSIVAGDLNGDCQVDRADLEIMALHWTDDEPLLP